MTKIESRVKWLKANKSRLERARTSVSANPRGGSNAAHAKGMSGGGWGWWARALHVAGIRSDKMSYWSGSNPTASTAINKGLATYIERHAPSTIR